MFASCVSLKLATTHKPLLTIAINGVPGCTRCPTSTDLRAISPAAGSNIPVGKLLLSVFNRGFRLPDRSFSSILLRSTDFSLFARSLRLLQSAPVLTSAGALISVSGAGMLGTILAGLGGVADRLF